MSSDAPAEPFRGIRPYRFKDRGIFFERDGDARRLMQAVAIHRGILFYGESGLGKSSVINARLVPDAFDAGFVPERVRVRPEPGAEFVVEAIDYGEDAEGAYGNTRRSIFIPPGSTEPVTLSIEQFEKRLNSLSEDDWPLLIFDQFEEIVTLFRVNAAHGRKTLSDTQSGIVNALLGMYANQTLAVKQLFVFREDYLAKIHRLFVLQPEFRGQSVRLEPIAIDKAYRIIRGPFDEYPDSFSSELSPALAENIVEQLRVNASSNGNQFNPIEAPDTSPPTRSQGPATKRIDFSRDLATIQESPLNLSVLQIVCYRLWRSREPDDMFARRGVKGLLEDYLKDTLAAFPASLQEPAITLLTKLVTTEGTRNVVSKSDLLGDVEEGGLPSKQRYADALAALEIDGRLVQRETRHDADYYEIVSEFLIPWIRDQKAARQLAEAQHEARRQLWSAVRWAGVLAVAFVVAISLLLWALAARRDADAQRAIFEQTARSRQLAAQVVRAVADRLDVALLLGVAANDEQHDVITVESRSSLLTALSASPHLMQFLQLHVTEPTDTDIAIHPDGTAAAVFECTKSDNFGCVSREVRLWSLITDTPISSFDAGTLTDVRAVTFSPDGSRLAAVGLDGLTVWDMAGGASHKLGRVAVAQDCEVSDFSSVAFGPDADTLVVGTDKGCVLRWKVDQQSGLPLTGSHTRSVTSVAVSADGQYIASGDAGGIVVLWDVNTGRPIQDPLVEHGSEVEGIAFDGDGATITSVGHDGRIILSDLSGQVLNSGDQPQLPSEVQSVAFRADGNALAAGAIDGVVFLWSVAEQGQVERLIGHNGPIIGLSFTEDGSTLVSVGIDNLQNGEKDARVLLWDAARRHTLDRSIAVLADEATSVAVNANGKLLAVGTRTGLKVFDLTAESATERPLAGATEPVYSVAFDPQEWLLATGSDGRAELWDLSAGVRRGVLPVNERSQVLTVAFSPDGSTLAIGTSTGEVVLWDLHDSDDGAAALAATASPTLLPPRPPFQIRSVAFSDNGALLAAAGDDGRIVVWDIDEGSSLDLEWQPNNDVVRTLAFSPDQTLLAAGGENGKIVLWNLEEGGEPEPLLDAHSGLVLSLTFSADGTLLASAGQDGQVLLWDVENRMPLEPALADRDGVTWTLAFSLSETDQLLAAAGTDGAVVVWDVDLDHWRDRACRIAGRKLTPEEVEQYEIEADVCPGNKSGNASTPAATEARTGVTNVYRSGA